MSFVVRGLVGVASVVWPTLSQAQTAPSAQTAPAALAAPAAKTAVQAKMRVYMRNEGTPLTFSARTESGQGSPTWCIAPCDVELSPGNYRLKLNSVTVSDPVALRHPGTLHGEYRSGAGARSAAWLALNVGGIIGGVFITVGIAGSAPNAFYVGGGVLAGAGVIFLVTYRADKASISFTPDPPADVRGIPDPATSSGSRQSSLDRPSLGSAPRGLGFRIAF